MHSFLNFAGSMEKLNFSTDGGLAWNSTENNETTYALDGQYSISLNCLVIALSVSSIICNSFALNIISKCRKTSYQIRFLSSNLLSCFITIETNISLHSIAMLMVGDKYYKLIFDSRIFFCCVLVAVLWGSLCAVTVERLVALTSPLQYNRYVTKTTLSVSIASLWILNMVAPLLAFIFAGIKICSEVGYVSCNIYDLFQPARMVLAAFLLVYALIIVIAYIQILVIVFRHHRRGELLSSNTKYLADVAKKQKYIKSTKTVAAIILAFIVLQSPVAIHTSILDIMPKLREQKWRVIFQAIDYLGHQMNTYATLYLYIWKYRECKMHLLFLLSKVNKNMRPKAEALRLEVFDVVLKETSSGNHAQIQKVLSEGVQI